jgi:hypothetical protein
VVGRTAGPSTLEQRAPYYDTLDDREHDQGHGQEYEDGYGKDYGPGVGHGRGTGDGPAEAAGEPDPAPLPPDARTGGRRVGPRPGVKGTLFTGALAVAVLLALGVAVSGQVEADRDASGSGTPAAAGAKGAQGENGILLGGGGGEPSPLPPAWNLEGLTYDQRMGLVYDIGPELDGPGSFTSVPGTDEAPHKGDEMTYRVDVEDELGLNGELFADAVHKTLNDRRSWAHDGLAFTRVPEGGARKPDFVITLASPGTTAEWCAKSGLDTTVDNVSCDSASTSRVMINAYRWARGSETYGDQRIHEYRQMLINHEVGHRLGYGHVECSVDGGLAPVMQQQTKFLDHDGIHCKPNAWAYPNG